MEVSKNKKLMIALVVFTALGLGIFYVLTAGKVGIRYDTVPVEMNQVAKYVEDTGVISSSDIRTYYGHGQAKVEKVSIELGDSVKKGDLLIQYKNTVDLDIEKIKKQIEALEAGYKEVLSGSDVSSISTARIEISKSNKELDNAKARLERTKKLYENGAVSLVEYENAQSEVERLTSDLEISQNAYSKLTRDISENNKKKYEAEIDVLILSLEILENSREDYAVYSDINGIVTEVNTFEGDRPSAGKLIVEVMDPAQKVILIDFMVEDARSIEVGMEAMVHDPSLNIDIDNLRVSMVYPKAFVSLSELNVEENRQRVEVELYEAIGSLAFGTEVKARVMVEPKRQALVIPVAALIYDQSKTYVEIVEDNEAQRKEVVIGTTFDGKVEVLEGLKEGDELVLNYQESE